MQMLRLVKAFFHYNRSINKLSEPVMVMMMSHCLYNRFISVGWLVGRVFVQLYKFFHKCLLISSNDSIEFWSKHNGSNTEIHLVLASNQPADCVM